MNNTTEYKKMFNNIWNTQVLTSAYEIKSFYRNGLRLKYCARLENE